MGQIYHNKEAEINQNKYSYVIVFMIILTYCFITKLTAAIAMHGNKIPYNVASCDVAIKHCSINQCYLWMVRSEYR